MDAFVLGRVVKQHVSAVRRGPGALQDGVRVVAVLVASTGRGDGALSARRVGTLVRLGATIVAAAEHKAGPEAVGQGRLLVAASGDVVVGTMRVDNAGLCVAGVGFICRRIIARRRPA